MKEGRGESRGMKDMAVTAWYVWNVARHAGDQIMHIYTH